MVKQLKQFDIVTLKTIKNVKYLSSTPGHMPSPQGSWSIVGFINKDVLLCKDGAIIKIPPADIELKAEYQPPIL